MTISTQRLRLLRGNSTAAGAFTGLQGELIFDTTLYTLRLQDGVTPGGYTLATTADLANVVAGEYSNTNVASYLPTYSGNLTAGNIFSNNYLYANGVSILTGIQSNYGNSNVASYLPTYSGNLTAGNIVSGNILPSANVTYSLGSATSQWKDLWLSNNTLYLDSIPITVANGTLSVNGTAVGGNVSQLSRGAYTVSLEVDGDVVFPGNIVSSEAGLQSYLDLHQDLGNVVVSSVQNVLLTANNSDIPRIWSFDTDGILTLPSNTSAINYPNGVSILNGITANGGGNYSNANVASYLPTYTGNIAANIVKNGHTWTFGNNGSLVIPSVGDISGSDSIYSSISLASLYSTFAGSENVQIYANNSGTTQQWLFDTDGILTLPSGGQIGALQPGAGVGIDLFASNTMSYAQVNYDNKNYIYVDPGVSQLQTPNVNIIAGTTAKSAIIQVADPDYSLDNSWTFYPNGSADIPGTLRYASDKSSRFELYHDGFRLDSNTTGGGGSYIDGMIDVLFLLGGDGGTVLGANGHTWDFLPNGNIRLPANNSIISYFSGENILSNINGNSITANIGTFNTIYGTLGTASQTGITTLGTLTGLAVSGTTNMTTLQVSGNATIGNLLVTGNSTIIGNITQISGNSGQFFGNASTGFNALYTGIAAGYTPLQHTIIQSSGNFNDYVQINLENVNSGNAATADYIVTADNGTDATYYVDMGIASSNFDGLSPNIVGNSVRANDAYLYTLGNGAGNQGGNLIIGAGTAGKIIKIIAGGGHEHDVVATVAAGAFTVNGNITGTYIFGNGSQLTGVAAVTATTATYVTGLTSANVTTALGFVPANSNAASSYGNTNVAAYLTTYGGAINANTIIVTANATVNGLTVNTSGVFTTTLQAKGGIQATPIGNVTAASGQFTTVSGTGNVTGANIIANGNVTGTYFIGNGALLTGITANTTYSNTNVASYLTGNIVVGNVSGSQPNVTLVANTYSYIFDNVGNITIPGNINYANGINILSGLGGGAGNYSNSNVASYLPTYSGNVNAAYYFGNGSQLTDITSTTAITAQYVTGLTSANVTTALGYVPLNSNSAAVSANIANSATTATFVTGLTGTNVNVALGYVPLDSNSTAITATTAQYVTGLTSANVTTALGFVPANSNAASNYGNTNVTAFLGEYGSNTVVTTGNITAGYFVGNGSLLTGIVASGANYSNANVAAYLPVYGGPVNANTITGTANATVNGLAVNNTATIGSTLGVTGNINGSSLTLSGSGVLTNSLRASGGLQATPIGNVVGMASTGSFTTITANANVTASALTVNNSATIGSTLGVTGNLTVAANMTVTANVVAGNLITSGTGGNITGVNIVYGNVIGSGNTTVQDFTVNGNATIGGNLTISGVYASYAPARAAMRVYGNTSTNWTAGTTISNQVIDYNQGSYYSNSTGLFTAPIAGLYHCYATVRVGNNNALNQAALLKNGTASGANVIAFWETDTNAGVSSHFSITGYAKCVAGDTLSLKVIAGNVQFDSNDSWGVTYIG